MTSLKTLSGLILLFLVASCSGSSGPRDLAIDGARALGSKDYTSAVSKLDRALLELDPETNAALKARLERCRALAHLDAKQAKTDFLALMETGKVRYGHYSIVVDDFANAGAFTEATAILTAGFERLKGEPKMKDLLDHIGKRAENAGVDQATLDALKGLGYVGN